MDDLIPPTFLGQPLLYAATVFALLMINLLAMEWTWRTAWALVERPAPLRHPVSALRWTLLLLLISLLMRTVGDGILLASWRELTPQGRVIIGNIDNLSDAVSFVPFSLAWIAAWLGEPVVAYQLRRQPIPIHLWPTARQMRRPLKIGLGVAAISLAIAFAR